MGVKYAWQLLRDKKLVPDSQDKVSLLSTVSKIRVDVCSTHNTPIRYYYGNPTDLYAAHGKLEQWLLKIGDKEKVRFYIDGLPAAEKVKTHTNRHQSRQKALIKASTAISSLESRLAEGKRIRKLHITGAHNPLRQAFHWSLEDRMSFVEYMANKDYDIVLCPTESDVLIAAECQTDDAVISCDSDLLFYKTVPVVWRPVGSYKSRRFVPFEKNAVLEALGLSSTQLTTLAIVSGNDYVSNIPHLAIASNRGILNNLDGDEMSVIRQYLAHPQVKRRTDQEGDKWSEESYADAIKVFVRMQQSISSDSSPPSSAASNDSVAPEDPTKVTSEDSAQDASLSYSFLRERMDRFMNAFDVFKTNAYEARVAKRVASDAQSEPEAETKIMNPFATIDKQNPANAHQYRPRFSPKVRFEPSKEQSAPPISMQYILKPWKETRSVRTTALDARR
ncbi:hypothetical protein K457DRAFT_453980 [Linnemannia elongata AG-77]|uniref:PIN domain-like protein n=1 Tax=Linnemannia elongata AG-77 TaxID=1314771 RepID=A0A197JAC3_9FUNG|nr:hypothetical protein K457DRAFT_453980 [Linnemannia elongata AG-77]